MSFNDKGEHEQTVWLSDGEMHVIISALKTFVRDYDSGWDMIIRGLINKLEGSRRE